jgi:hypothetical protein
VPWCPNCERFLSPSTVHADGSCPTCGRAVDPGAAKSAHAAPATVTDPDAASSSTVSPASVSGAPDTVPQNGTEPDEEVIDPIPWHFKLLLGAIALYLGYRAFQGIEWIAGLL